MSAEVELGQRLRAAREARGWSVADAATRLHLPTAVLQGLESGDYSRIGNGVYLRGYLSSFLRLLSLPAELIESVIERAPPAPALITSGAVSRPRYLYNRYSVPTIYLILTGLIVVPAVWLTTHGGLEQTVVRVAPLDAPAEHAAIVPSAATLPAPLDAQPEAASPIATPTIATTENHLNETPLIASFTPALNAKAATPAAPPVTASQDNAAHHVRLTLTEESWVEILGADGKRLDYGLLPAGTRHEYSSDGALDIRIGNSNGATLEVDGNAVDLAPYRRSNVARLKLFSDGEKTAHSDS